MNTASSKKSAPLVSAGAPSATPTGVESSATPGATGQQQVKNISKDANVISTVLKDMGISDYEPAVVHQLLEFAYRYVTTVLDDAQIFSHYAKKKNIDAEDVRLAIQLQVDKMFTSPPPRDLLLDIARHKNSQSLPPIKSHCGPRLPPDRYSLIVCNYKLKSQPKVKAQQNPVQTHIQLPFRSGNSILAGLTNRPAPLITVQARSHPTNTYGNRIAIANPVEASGEVTPNESIKRKHEDDEQR